MIIFLSGKVFIMIKIVPKIILLMEIFASGEEYSFSEITEKVRLSKSNVSHLLKSLCECDILEKSGYGKYRRGYRFSKLCSVYNPSHRLMSIAERCANNLVGLLNELAVISLRSNEQRLTVVKLRPEKNIQVDHERHYLADWYSTASGRILLAHAPEDIVKQVLKRYGVPSRQAWREAITLPKMKRELAVIKEQGFSTIDVDDEIRAIGVPVRDASGEFLLSISTAFATFKRLKSDEEIIEQLRFLASSMEQEICLNNICVKDLKLNKNRVSIN